MNPFAPLLLWGALAAPPTPAVPVEPIAAIVEAFRDHEIVTLSDAHGSQPAQAFLKRLVRDPRFAATVNDIVVEFGNARYQELVDRFVRGEEVPEESIRAAWQNTTVANEISVDEEFFRVIRGVNASLPRERQLRVLLGDPPIDWRTVLTRDDHFPWLAMRDSYPAALIQIEVLAKQRRALVVYGHMHFQRRNVLSNLNMQDWRAQTIVSLLERSTPARIFTIWGLADELIAVQPDVASWSTPSLTVVRGTTVGAADVSAFSPAGWARMTPAMTPIPREEWLPLRAEEQFDAVLYLGPRSAITRAPLSPGICADQTYIKERLRRIALTGIPQFEADRIKQLCAGTPKQ